MGAAKTKRRESNGFDRGLTQGVECPADAFGCPVRDSGGERKKMPEGVEGCEVGVRADQKEVGPGMVPGARKAGVPQEAERQASELFHPVWGQGCEQRVGETRVAQIQ